MNRRRARLSLLLLTVPLLACCGLFIGGDRAGLPPDGSAAVWYLDPDSPPPGREDTSFAAMVTERACSSGREIRNILMRPVIEYRHDAIVVSLYVEPLPQLAANEAVDCIGTAPTRFAIQLAEPLGERRLVDGIGGEADDPN